MDVKEEGEQDQREMESLGAEALLRSSGDSGVGGGSRRAYAGAEGGGEEGRGRASVRAHVPSSLHPLIVCASPLQREAIPQVGVPTSCEQNIGTSWAGGNLQDCPHVPPIPTPRCPNRNRYIDTDSYRCAPESRHSMIQNANVSASLARETRNSLLKAGIRRILVQSSCSFDLSSWINTCMPYVVSNLTTLFAGVISRSRREARYTTSV